jgi:polyisoprenoid-binding protein YceI
MFKSVRKSTHFSRLFIAALALSAASAFAGWSKDGEAQATFSGTGPAGFKIDGKTPDVSVKDDGKNFTVVVALKNLTTGIGLRDSHMREKYLEVEKFPDATLSVPLSSLKLEDGKTSEAEGKGTFSVHGKSKELSFKYKANCKSGTCDIEGTIPVNMKDFDVNVPSYLGVTVKPDIVVKTSFKAKKN